MKCYYCNCDVKEVNAHVIKLTKNKQANNSIEIKELALDRCNKCFILHKIHLPLSIFGGLLFVFVVLFFNYSAKWHIIITFCFLIIALYYAIISHLYRFIGIKAADDVDENYMVKELLNKGWNTEEY